MHTVTFDRALKVVESLPEKQRDDLVEIVQRRLAEGRRDSLALEIHEAREEYTRGKVRKGTVTELLEDLHQ
jgi:hypothetical protein